MAFLFLFEVGCEISYRPTRQISLLEQKMWSKHIVETIQCDEREMSRASRFDFRFPRLWTPMLNAIRSAALADFYSQRSWLLARINRWKRISMEELVAFGLPFEALAKVSAERCCCRLFLVSGH